MIISFFSFDVTINVTFIFKNDRIYRFPSGNQWQNTYMWSHNPNSHLQTRARTRPPGCWESRAKPGQQQDEKKRSISLLHRKLSCERIWTSHQTSLSNCEVRLPKWEIFIQERYLCKRDICARYLAQSVLTREEYSTKKAFTDLKDLNQISSNQSTISLQLNYLLIHEAR